MKPDSKNQHIKLLIFVFPLLMVAGCDNDEARPENHITFDKTKYSINQTVLIYLGERDLIHNDNQTTHTHYEYSIWFTDGTLNKSGGSVSGAENATYLLSFSVFTTISNHSPEFTGGTFDPVLPQDYFGAKSPTDKNFFTTFLLRTDVNGDSIFEGYDNWADASDGQIKINGSDDKYVILINNQTTDQTLNVPVTGRFEGAVEVIR